MGAERIDYIFAHDRDPASSAGELGAPSQATLKFNSTGYPRRILNRLVDSIEIQIDTAILPAFPRLDSSD
jgi:hypothetical protein